MSILPAGSAVSAIAKASATSFYKGKINRSSFHAAANLEASNPINGLRLQRQLALEEISTMFKPNGELSKAAIEGSTRLWLPLNNSYLKQILSDRPGNLSDWGKYQTVPIHTPGGLARMHFYHNPMTGDVYYGIDFKTIFDHQGKWNLELKPKFEYEPQKFNH